MGKNRLEAFSDGVLAIIITIMVLEMKVPHGSDLAALAPLLSVFLSYVLSFVYVGIYWNNHHHLLHAVKQVSGGVLWANLNLLFWLSLLPFATGWMGENHFSALPSAVYGFVLLMAAIAYYLLQTCIVSVEGSNSILKQAIGSDWKGKLSPLLVVSQFEAPSNKGVGVVSMSVAMCCASVPCSSSETPFGSRACSVIGSTQGWVS